MRVRCLFAILTMLSALAVSPAHASLSYVFSGSNAGFSSGGNLNVDCFSPYSTNPSTVDFSCALTTLPTSTTQTITNSGSAYSLYYNLAGLTTNEESTSWYRYWYRYIDSTEAGGTHTLDVTFAVDFGGGQTLDFTLSPPVAVSAGAYFWSFGSVTFYSTNEGLLIPGQSDYYLIATLLFAHDNYPNSTSGHLSASDALNLVDEYTWTANSRTRYFYLGLYYDTPEPATFVLIGSALVGLGLLRRRKRA